MRPGQRCPGSYHHPGEYRQRNHRDTQDFLELPASRSCHRVSLTPRAHLRQLAGLTTEQVRRVIRWIRRGEIVDDRAVAEAVIVFARNQERSEPWGCACAAVLAVSAFRLSVGVARQPDGTGFPPV